MRVELILEAIDRASGPIRAVREALTGVAAAEKAAQATGGVTAGMTASGPARGRFGAVYLPPPAIAAPAPPAPAPPAPIPPAPPPPAPPAPAPAPSRGEKALKSARKAQGETQAQLLGAAAAAAAVAAPIAKAVAAYSAYEDALNDVGQKADMTGAKLAAFGENIRAQARLVNMSSADILKGVEQLAAGGMSVPDAAKAFPAVSRASIATKASMEDLSKTAVSLVNNMKILPDDVGKALDAMHQTGKDGQFELADMAQFFPKIGAQYAAMGQTGQKAVLDLAAALQVMRMNVGTAGQAVTNLGDLLNKMTMPQAAKAFKAAGIDVQKEMAEAAKSGRVMEAMFDIINRATGGDVSKVQDIFHDKQAREGAVALLQHFKEYLKIREAAANSGGVVDRDFATRMGLGVEKMRALQVATAELWTTLGQALAPAFLHRVDQLVAIVNAVEAWVKANPALAASLAQVASAVAGLLVVSAALAFAFATLRLGLLAPLIWLGRLGGLAGGAAGGVRLLAGAARLLALPFRLAWWAVSGLASGLVSGLASGVAAVGGWGVVARLVVGRLVGLFGLLLSPLRLAAQAALAFGAAMMTTPVGWIAAGLAALAAAAWLIYRNWSTIGPWLARLWASIRTAAVAAWEGLLAWVSGLGARIGAALASGWGAVTARLKAAWASVTAFFASLSWPPLPSLGDLFDAPLKTIRESWSRLVAWFGSLAWPALPDPLVSLRAALEPALVFLSDWGGRVKGALATAFEGVSSVLGKLGGVAGAAIDKVTSGLSAARSFVFGPSAADLASSAEQAAAAKAAIAALAPAATQAVAAVRAIFAGANFTSEGVAMMTTLATGIRNGASSAVAAARVVVSQIRDHLPHSPAKVGPLSDLDRVQFGQTLALAIAAGAPKAVAAARALAEGLASTLPAAPAPAYARAQFARPDPRMGRGAAGEGVSAGGHGAIHLTFAPTLHGGAGQGDLLGQMKSASYELVELIRAELDRRDRAKH